MGLGVPEDMAVVSLAALKALQGSLGMVQGQVLPLACFSWVVFPVPGGQGNPTQGRPSRRKGPSL